MLRVYLWNRLCGLKCGSYFINNISFNHYNVYSFILLRISFMIIMIIMFIIMQASHFSNAISKRRLDKILELIFGLKLFWYKLIKNYNKKKLLYPAFKYRLFICTQVNKHSKQLIKNKYMHLMRISKLLSMPSIYHTHTHFWSPV